MRNKGKMTNRAILSLLLAIGFLVSTIATDRSFVPAAAAKADTGAAENVAALQAKAAAGELTGKTAAEVVNMMGMGWNIGNTFDATGGLGASHETSWGNPKVTKELIHAVKEAGFNVIRIPTTWAQEINASKNYEIRAEFLARVKEVVDWCYEEDMFVILNVHHESWLNIKTFDKDYRKIGVELGAVWAQIAEYFADYDQHLIFEGMNEPRMAGSSVEWTGNKEAYQAVNYLLQVFAQTVRANGKGHNGERCLMIPGYAASCSSKIMEAVSLPTYNGEVVSNLIASVHCYSPYNFCLQDTQMTFGSGDASEIDGVFRAIKAVYLDNGIPAVLGETSATEKNNTEERVKWAQCMGEKSQAYGIPIVIWDNGSDSKKGGESHAYINRRTCEWNYPTVIKGLFDGFNSVERGSALTETKPSGGANGTYIFVDTEGRKPDEEWKASFFTTGAKDSWFEQGRKFEFNYTGETGEPKLILDSETKQKWWIPVEPTGYDTKNGRKILYYDYNTIMAAMAENGITDPSDLRNFMVVCTSMDVTLYYITISGVPKAVYYVNGTPYASGSKIPADPELKDWVFEGWYLDKTYTKPFSADTALEGDATVYAKLRLKTDEEIAAEITPTPEPTPTTAPTATTAPTSAPEATVTTAPEEAQPTPTPAIAEDGNHEAPSSLGWKLICAVGIGVLILIGVAVALRSKLKK